MNESLRRQPVSPIKRMRVGRATGSGTGTPSTVTAFAPGVMGREQTRMGKSPPGSDRVRIGMETLSIAAGGHCALSVIARASRPPGTYWTQRASSAVAVAVDIVTANMPNTTAHVVRCMNFPKPSTYLARRQADRTCARQSMLLIWNATKLPRAFARDPLSAPTKPGSGGLGTFRFEVERDAVDAIAQMSGRRAVVEHVPEMAAATVAMNLGAHHAVGAVLRGLNRTRDRIVEARPTGSALEFLHRLEQRLAAARTAKRSAALLVVQRAASRPLRPVSAHDVVLLRRKQATPLGIGVSHRKLLVLHVCLLRAKDQLLLLAVTSTGVGR